MARFELRIKPSAVKEIESVEPRSERRRIVVRITGLAEEPRPAGCRRLAGEDRYRLRQGADRILYSIDHDDRIVIVVKVGHRREVYRARR